MKRVRRGLTQSRHVEGTTAVPIEGASEHRRSGAVAPAFFVIRHRPREFEGPLQISSTKGFEEPAETDR